MNAKIARLFFLLLVYAHPTWSQFYSSRQFTVKDGLPTSQITSLLKDSLGYLWIGTHGGGLVRFDGDEFVTYNDTHGLVDNYVTSLCFDREGQIWIGTLTGISRFNGITFATIDLNLGDKLSAKAQMIKQLAFHKGQLYSLNDSGMLGMIQGDKVNWFYRGDAIKWLVPQVSDDILLQMYNDELWSLGNSSVRMKLPKGLTIWSVEDFRGRKVINTTQGWFQVEDGVRINQALKNYTTGPLFINANDSTVWNFGSSLTQGRLSNISAETQFDNISQITCSQFDLNGDLWVGSYTHGLFHLGRKPFEKIFSSGQDVIMPIERGDRGSFWFGSYGNGILKYNSKKINRYQFNDDIRKNYITSLKFNNDRLWMGTYGGLGYFKSDKVNWVLDDQKKPIDSVISIDIDQKGRTWVGRAQKGIELFENDELTHYPFPSEVAISIKFVDIDSSLYIGTFQGIYRLFQGKISKLSLDNLNLGIVRSMDVYKNRYVVFASERKGLCLYDPAGGRIIAIPMAEYLPSSILIFVKVDGDDLWIGTIKGISRVKLNEEFKPVSVKSYDHNHGFEGIEANSNSFCFSSKERLFGSTDGVYRFREVKAKEAHYGKLHMQDIKLFYDRIAQRGFDSLYGFFKIPYSPTLKATENHLTFKFKSVEYSPSSKILYSYTLDGFDKQWSKRSLTNEVTYSAIPPGQYMFKVRTFVENSDDIIDEIEYPFYIEPPFYQTTWFLSVAILCIIFFIIITFRFQLRRRLARAMEFERVKNEENQRLRQEIGRDFHDELGNHLVMVSNNVNLLLLDAIEQEKKEILMKIEQSIRYINLRTRDFIWSINPTNNNLDDLFLYLRDFGEGLFRNTRIIFRAENDVSAEYTLPYKFTRESILIFKEAFTNALKHSNAKNVFFRLRSEGSNFFLEIVDDGVGMQNQNKKSGGLSNIYYRAVKIGAKLSLDSGLNAGTRVKLNFDLKGINN